jgi:WXG100 family type VII secretion target
VSALVVDLGGLAELVERMARFESQLGALRGEVETRMRQLDGTWSGVAEQACREADAQWRAGAGEVHAALVAMRAIAATAHANYEAAVHANRRMWAP